jgi:hypothetical protein
MLPMTTFTAHTTVRLANQDDLGNLARLCVLDSTRALSFPVLVAETDGVMVAARSLTDGREAADPFKPTADVLAMVRVRAEQLTAERDSVRRRLRARFSPVAA